MATAVKERATTTPRDIYLGDRQVCCGGGRGAGPAAIPGARARPSPSRCPRSAAGHGSPPARTRWPAVGDELMPAAAAARRYGVSDRTAALAFTEYADAQLADLDEHPDPVRRPGSTSSAAASPPGGRRGRARSQWFTHLVDLSSGGPWAWHRPHAQEGLLGAHPRAALPGHGPVRPLPVRRPCRGHRRRRRVPPGQARHRKIDDAFRAVLPHRAPARGTRPAPPAALHAPAHIESLDPDTWAPSSAPSTGRRRPAVAAVWIAKEQLRALLALRTRNARQPRPQPGPGQARRLLPMVRAPPAHPELKTLAATMTAAVIDAVLPYPTLQPQPTANPHPRTPTQPPPVPSTTPPPHPSQPLSSHHHPSYNLTSPTQCYQRHPVKYAAPSCCHRTRSAWVIFPGPVTAGPRGR